MKGNKKGLSDVVTSVLLILLVLASVVILWQFIRPAIVKGGQSVTTVCLSLELQPVSCAKSSDAAKPNVAIVTYKWAGGDVNLTSVKLILESVSGNAKVVDGTALNRLETKTQEVDFGGVPAKFTVAGIAISEAGVPTTCPENTNKVVCS